MSRIRKILVWLRVGFISVPAIACVMAVGLYAAMQTESGRALIVRLVERALSEPDGQQVTIQGLSGALPQAIRLDRLEIRDADGVWLTASSLVLDWRPWRLLLGEVSVTSLSIGEIAVAWLPADDGQAAGLPRINLEIGEFAIGKIALASPVLGTEATLTVSGHANIRPGRALDAYFDVERSDGQQGVFRAEAAYRPADDHLTLNLQIQESDGGIVAHLLDLPTLPSFRIGVQGEGPVSRWRGQLAATATGIAEIRAEATLARDATIQWDITGDATIRSADGAAMPPLIVGRHAFRLSGSWAPGDRLAVETLRSSGDSLSVDGHARWDIAGDRVSAWLSGRVDGAVPLALADEIALSGPMALEVAAEGSAKAPDIRWQITAARLAFGGRDLSEPALNGQLQLRLGRDSRLQGFGFNLSAKAAGANFDGDDALHAILQGPLALHAEGVADLARNKIDLHNAELKADSLAVTAKGQLDLSSGAGQGDLALTLADLSRLSPVTGVAMRGRMNASGPVTLREAGVQMTLDVSGNLSDLSVEEPALQALLGKDVRFKGDISSDSDSLRVTNLSVDTAHASVTGGLALTDSFSRVSAEYNVVLPDAAVVNTVLGVEAVGRAETAGHIVGAVADPHIDGVFSLDRIGSEGVFLDTLSVDYRVQSLAGELQGRLEGKAEWQDAPVRLTTGFRLRSDDLVLDELRIDTHDTTVQGALTVPTGGKPLHGALMLRAETFRPWLLLASLKGDGRLSGEIKLSNESGRQGAVLDATVERARLSPPDIGPITAERLKLSVRTRDLFALESVALVVDGTGLDVDDLRLASFSINGDGNLSGANFRLQAIGKWVEELFVEASGRLSIDEKKTELELRRLDGTALGESFALRSPLRLAWSGEQIAARGVDIAVGTGWLRGSLDLGPQVIGLNAEAEGLSLAPMRAFQPTVPKGLLSGNARVSGTRPQPEGILSIRLTGLQLPDTPEEAKVELLLDGRWRGSRVSLDGKLKGAFPEDGVLSADLPLRLAATGFAIELPKTEPMSGALRWQGDIAGVWALVPVAEHRLAGLSTLDLSLTGSIATPRIRGSIVLTDGQYESVVSGTLMRRLNVKIVTDGNELRLAQFDAEDGDRGKITADGRLTLDPGRSYPFQLNAHFQDFYVVRRDDVDGTASGDIVFEGNRLDSRIHGTLKTERVEVHLLDRLPPDVVSLDVVEVRGDEPPEQNRVELKTEPLFNPVLDIAVSLPRRVFVRGRGLDSEWEGDLQVEGSVGQPRVTGQLTLVRGFMDVVGKTFRLSRGTVTVPPGEMATPKLDVAATYNMTGYTVTVSVNGPVTAPAIKLSSAPFLPQDEIVSRVLFDKSTTRLTSAEAVQLAIAMSDLTGVGGAGGVMAFARRTLGVDVLRFEETEVNGNSVPAVSAGKYLTDRVYVDVRQGATPESGAVGVEVELTPNISLDSEVQRSGAGNFGVKFKFDY